MHDRIIDLWIAHKKGVPRVPLFTFWWTRRRFRQRRIYLRFSPDKPACRSSSLVCAPVFECRALERVQLLCRPHQCKKHPKWCFFKCIGGYHLLVNLGTQGSSQMTDGSLPSRSVNSKNFKVCIFILSLRQFSEPDSVRCTERVQLQCRSRQKAKGTHKASLSLFGGPDGS